MKAILATIVLFAIFGLLQAQTNDSLSSRSQQDSIVVLDVLPSFPGGEDSLNTFLLSRIVYPKEAQENFVHGTVYVSFEIDEDGIVRDIRCVRGIGAGCDEETMRVISLMPRWSPAIKNGKPIKTIYTLPVRFIQK